MPSCFDFRGLAHACPVHVFQLLLYFLYPLLFQANALSGPLPPDFSTLVNLQLLTLANNGLTGTIPVRILCLNGVCSMLLHALVQHDNFTAPA